MNNLKKEFAPYEESLELKELGFDEPCLIKDTEHGEDCAVYYIHENGKPTYSQAFGWFREKYNLLGTPQYFYGGFYCYTVNDMKDTKESNRLFSEFETFEEAELACLRKLIEIAKGGEE